MGKAERKVLIITPYFAPQSHAAVFRAFKLAKYLPRYGWTPFVLTVDTNYNYYEDSGLLSQLPGDVKIVRSKYVEPTLRGLRMMLGGRDRSFSSHVSAGVHSSNAVKVKGPSFSQKAYRYLLERYLNSPDAYWTWRRSAVREAKKLIAENDIGLIYTSCVPYTSNQIGLDLKASGVKWVADFRDAPTYCHRTFSRFPSVFLKQKEIELNTLLQADASTGLSSCYPLIFSDMYKLPENKKMRFIPTGVDDDYLKSEDKGVDTKSPYFIFVGEYLEEYRDTFFKIFAKCEENENFRKQGFKILIVGNGHINKQRSEHYIEKLGIGPKVEFIDHMPQTKLYHLIRSAKAALLIPGSESYWWTNFAKLVDYIALQTQVIAMVPNPSEALTELGKCGLGVFLDGSTQRQVETLT